MPELSPDPQWDYLLEELIQGVQWTSEETLVTKADGQPALKEKDYNKPIKALFTMEKQIPMDKMIGLEIEVEGSNLFTTPVSFWLAKTDGSLRPYKGHPPIEYVLREPVSRDNLEEALDYLLRRLNRKETELALSARCSVHVHLNCQRMTMMEVLKFLALYLVFEDLMVEWCGPERPGNLFCLRAKDAHDFIKVVANCIAQDYYGHMMSDQVRYTSCNVAALQKFGSVEFRALRGTTDKETILTWVDMLLQLKGASLRFKYPTSIIETFNTLGPENFMTTVLGDYAKKLSRLDLVHQRIWDGVRLIREIVYCTDWQPPIPRIERKRASAKAKIAKASGVGS